MANTDDEEEVWCECSDDETYNPCKLKKGTWEPTAEDMMKVFEELKTKKVLELKWKCPGRRPPESDQPKEPEIREEVIEKPQKPEEKRPVSPSEFDFDDFSESKPTLTPRRTPGSAPKSQRMARMDKVLKEVMHQRKIQQAEREAKRLAKSPRAPGSPSRARLGSPAGSPRTPPAALTPSNRQSPVISTSSTDSLPTTPVRAPDTLIRTSIYDSLTSAAVSAPSSNISNSAIEGTPTSTVQSTTPSKSPIQAPTPGNTAVSKDNISKEVSATSVTVGAGIVRTVSSSPASSVESSAASTSVTVTDAKSVQAKSETTQEKMDTS